MRLALILILLLLPTLAQAQDNQQPSNSISVSGLLNSINIPTTIDQLRTKAVNGGVFYNWKRKEIQPTYTYPLHTQNVGTWGQWDAPFLGYGSTDTLLTGTGFAINTGSLLNRIGIGLNKTIQNVANNSVIGLSINIGLTDNNGKKLFTGGPGAYVKVSF